MLVERENINNVICKCLKVWCAMTLVIGRMSYCVYILLDPDLDLIHLKVSKPCLGRFLLMWIDLQAVCGTQCLRQWWCCSGLQLFLNHCVLCALQCSFQSNLERNPQRSDVVKEEEREPGQFIWFIWSVYHWSVQVLRSYLTRPSFRTHSFRDLE